MQEFKFNVSGFRRKQLVGHISEILSKPIQYNGVPDFSYDCGEYHVDKVGTVTGEYDLNLFVGLAERGFEPEKSKTFHLITPRGTLLMQERFDTAEKAEAAGYCNYFHHEGQDVYVKTAPDGATKHSKHFALVGAPFETPAEDDTDRLTIEVPVLGFTPEHIENLNKMVLAKEALLKKALGIDELPIRMGLDALQFPWFPADSGENAEAYAQFICALCETAKEKKRVTAKAQESFENEKFAMRVWLIGLGLIGKEYGKIRKLLVANLSGDSSWRYGKPEKAAPVEEPAPATVENPVEEVASDD
jgi:hypothetical protein